jgi:hypothetical protein
MDREPSLQLDDVNGSLYETLGLDVMVRSFHGLISIAQGSLSYISPMIHMIYSQASIDDIRLAYKRLAMVRYHGSNVAHGPRHA